MGKPRCLWDAVSSGSSSKQRRQQPDTATAFNSWYLDPNYAGFELHSSLVLASCTLDRPNRLLEFLAAGGFCPLPPP